LKHLLFFGSRHSLLREKTPNARAGVILPDKFTYFNGYKSLRETLFKEFFITLVNLPIGTFSQTTGGGYILFLRRKSKEEVDGEKEPSFIKYYKAKKVGFTLNTAREPIIQNDLNDILSEKLPFQKITEEWLKNNNWAFRYKEDFTGNILLNDILEEIDPEKAQLKEGEKYCELKVCNYGYGVKRRVIGKKDYVYGEKIKSARWIVRQGQLIISKLQVRNGSIALIPNELDGSLISANYKLFQTKKDYKWLNLSFLAKYLTSEFYQSHFEGEAHGTSSKRAVIIEDFLSAPIFLTNKELKIKSEEFTEQQKLELKLGLELDKVRKKMKEIAQYKN
jgi:hypothetical protein